MKHATIYEAAHFTGLLLLHRPRKYFRMLSTISKTEQYKTEYWSCSKRSLRRLISKFEDCGHVADAPRSGRPLVINDKCSNVKETMEELKAESRYRESSAKEISKIAMIPVSTVRKIMRNLLGLFPYHIKHVQELLPQDYELRSNFTNMVIMESTKNPTWAQNILWSDEAHFYLHGGLNTRDCVIWAREQPHAIIEKPLIKDQKVTVWCSFTANFIIGLYFFEHADDHGSYTTTVNRPSIC